MRKQEAMDLWLGVYQSSSIWLCSGPTRPHKVTAPLALIGGRPMAARIATATAITPVKASKGWGRERRASIALG